jgi:hypothetical protein
MRVRHRIPSIFSLSMVDMLCCALGCVILLWLLNAKQQEDEAEEQAQATRELMEQARQERLQSEAQIAYLTEERDKTRANLEDLKSRLIIVIRDRDQSEKELKQQRATALEWKGDLDKSRQSIIVLEEKIKQGKADLESERKQSGGLSKQLAAMELRIRGLHLDLDQARAAGMQLEKRSRGLEQEIERRQKELEGLGRRLEEMQASRQTLERTLDNQEKALAQALPYKERWLGAEEHVRLLEKDLRDRVVALDQARGTLAALQGERKALQAAVTAARAAADNRFAGIELTGKRVLFLVDISGSMEMVDEKTMAPEKWVEVRNTVARLMRSLPGLEKYQVITFSKETSFPLGSAGHWLDHDPRKSPEQVLKTLAAIKPRGGTNMYDAFKAAFRYRALGLDTIYFLSDGLPNIGEGLPPGGQDLPEIERGIILGRHIRQTLRKDWNAPLPGRARVRINTIGFFFESPDLGAFLWALAREHEGSFVGMSKP